MSHAQGVSHGADHEVEAPEDLCGILVGKSFHQSAGEALDDFLENEGILEEATAAALIKTSGRYCGNEDCCASTGICGRITFGSGELDDHGYWETLGIKNFQIS